MLRYWRGKLENFSGRGRSRDNYFLSLQGPAVAHLINLTKLIGNSLNLRHVKFKFPAKHFHSFRYLEAVCTNNSHVKPVPEFDVRS